MADIATVWNETAGDWVQLGAALEGGDDLTTAVLISVFTDQTATADDIIPDAPQGKTGDPRGWWADEGQSVPIGSRLWLYGRAKQTEATLVAVKDAIQGALQWLIDDGVAAAVDVVCVWNGPGYLASRVTISRVDGSQVAVQFANQWG